MTSPVSTHPSDLRRNIWRALLCASDQEIHEGVSFYPGAHGLCALLAIAYKVDIQQVAGIYAALSPLNGWETNVSNVMSTLRYVVSGRYTSGVNTSTENERKALRIACGEKPEDVLRGRKVRAFYRGIVDPDDLSPIPVDRHLINLALGTKITDNQELRAYASDKDLYTRIERAYSELGAHEKLGNRLAAIAWFVQRRIQDSRQVMVWADGAPVCCNTPMWGQGSRRFYCKVCGHTRGRYPRQKRRKHDLPDIVLTDSGNVKGILPLSIDSKDRIRIHYGKHTPYMNSGGWQYLSRYVVMQKTSEVLREDEHVHHINGKLWDCTGDNLEVWLSEKHGRYHAETQLLYRLRDRVGRFTRQELPSYSEIYQMKQGSVVEDAVPF